MSRAFVKEPDGSEAEDFPDRLVSDHPNLVTARGFERIETEVTNASAAHATAVGGGDRGEIAKALRDLRYWTARRSTAELMPAPTNATTVQFGSTVTVLRDDGRRHTYQIVGEDEADPSAGSISYVSPLAQAMLGKSVGDSVAAGKGEAEITKIT